MGADTNIINPVSSISNPGFNRNSTLITPDEIRRNYLWGCKLVSPIDQTPYPDEAIQNQILTAISVIEHDLNVTITPTAYTENKDYRIEDYTSWCILNLQHTPVISVDTISVKWVNTSSTITFPQEWIRLDHLAGQVQLTPTAGTMAQWSFSIAGGIILPGGLYQRQDFPQLFEVVYTAGFEQDKIPYIINSLVAKYASIQILAQLTNAVIAPGIAGYSIGMDGLAQSVSKIPSPYMVLMQTLMDQFNQELKIAKGFYQRINFCIA